MKSLNLPRKDKDGNQYISYSQITSYLSDTYKNQYVLGYLFNIKDEGNEFSRFGGQVGVYLETSGQERGDMLDDSDVLILDELISKMEPLDGKEFEKEIKIQREGYYILGYIDLYYKTEENKKTLSNVVDFKTLSLAKKEAFYLNNDPNDKEAYLQTILYAKALELEGDEIGNCSVTGLDRTFAGTFQEPILHLSGVVKRIPTPYNSKNADIFLKKVDKVVEEISDLNTAFEKLNSLTIEV